MFIQILKSYTDHHLAKIAKADRDFAKTLDFKDIDFPMKIREIQKIEKKNSFNISVFGYENKEKYQDYVSELSHVVKKNILIY